VIPDGRYRVEDRPYHASANTINHQAGGWLIPLHPLMFTAVTGLGRVGWSVAGVQPAFLHPLVVPPSTRGVSRVCGGDRVHTRAPETFIDRIAEQQPFARRTSWTRLLPSLSPLLFLLRRQSRKRALSSAADSRATSRLTRGYFCSSRLRCVSSLQRDVHMPSARRSCQQAPRAVFFRQPALINLAFQQSPHSSARRSVMKAGRTCRDEVTSNNPMGHRDSSSWHFPRCDAAPLRDMSESNQPVACLASFKGQ